MEGGWEFFYSLLAGDGEGPCRSLMPFEVPAIIIKPEREGPRQWIMPFEVPAMPISVKPEREGQHLETVKIFPPHVFCANLDWYW